MSIPPDFYVVYEDQEITAFELSTIGPYQCVGDMIVGFQMRVLSGKYSSKGNFASFVTPQVVQLLQTYPEEIAKSIYDSLDLAEFRYVFFPISDINVQTRRANHWSLVILDRSESATIFRHFDSMNHSNKTIGRNFSQKLAKFAGLSEYEFQCLPGCPHQGNSYDCGVYVMGYIDLFVECDANHEVVCTRLTPAFAVEYRTGIEQHILRLAEGTKK
jgi:Ulp1 family protease